MRGFGIESEYASGAQSLIRKLYVDGHAGMDELHRYHCDCDACDPASEYPWRGQRDSTVDGEIISHIFHTNYWDFASAAINVLCETARSVDCTTSASTGMHIHVAVDNDEGDEAKVGMVALAYLLTERFFTEIVAPGSSRSKREMNTTLMQAFRSYISEYATGSLAEFLDERSTDNRVWWIKNALCAAIARDRHVDFNLSTTHPTFEFRAFNATLAEWRMELAARISVAFVERADEIVQLSDDASRQGLPADISQGVGSRFPTKRPLITMRTFVDVLCDYDPNIRALINRQTMFMRRRYRIIPAKPSVTE